MKKFEILASYISYVTYTVEAENKDDAVEKFLEGDDPNWGNECENDGFEIEEVTEITWE